VISRIGENGMIEKDEITLLTFVVTWVAWLFGFGKVYGTLTSKIDKHDRDIIIIKKEFTTGDGDQRFMSFSAHDKIQAVCQSHMNERHESLSGRLDKHEAKLDKILEVLQRP
jgi:hypothetical protein